MMTISSFGGKVDEPSTKANISRLMHWANLSWFVEGFSESSVGGSLSQGVYPRILCCSRGKMKLF